MSENNIEIAPDIWSGTFEFETESTFDCSRCLSTRSCKERLLFVVLDHVSKTEIDLGEVQLDSFITMTGFSDPKVKQWYQIIWDHDHSREVIMRYFTRVDAARRNLDGQAGYSADMKQKTDQTFKKVW